MTTHETSWGGRRWWSVGLTGTALLLAGGGCSDLGSDETESSTAGATDNASSGADDGGASAADAGTGGTGGGSDDAESESDGTGGGDEDTGIVPLYDESTQLEPETHFDRGDAIVTRFADRGRDRHAREDQFQSYAHYLPHYWEHRTARMMLVDYVSKGGSTIDIAFVTEWKLGPTEFRAWYSGNGTVAAYHGNYGDQFTTEGPGTYDNDLEKVSDEGIQYKYTYTIGAAIGLNGEQMPLAVGQFMEFENSQFLDDVPIGRDNYYGTTYLYAIGTGGVVPWYAEGSFEDQSSERENSHPLDEAGWSGGGTTLPYMYSDEPDNHYMQMATNLSSVNGQHFVLGRRVHHTDMLAGTHDESADNGVFTELANLVGPNYVNSSCDSCHGRNGRAPVAEIGEPLDKWVFKVGAADGGPDPLIGSVLQPNAADGGPGEGEVSIAQWIEGDDGLRSPVYAFSGGEPARFSARLAPPLVGMGLLEAIAESTVLEWHDPNDNDDDGISGRIQRVEDPVTGQLRLGRFGWKAGASSLTHQIAGALNTDMGVMTSVKDQPDCGPMQSDCGNTEGVELADEHLTNLVKYVALLGLPARRELDNPDALRGEEVFETLGCGDCHRADVTTSPFHPFTELRSQVIHPYSDLLLHDMGPGLQDSLGDGEASGAEWRTTPLWGIGLSACVTGGVEGQGQAQVCTPHSGLLHDGRARSIDEAIRWHGGESQASTEAYEALGDVDQAALLAFLESL